MDANQTRYHLLLGKDDWGACSDRGRFLHESWPPHTQNNSGFDLNEERSEVTLKALPFEFAESKGNRRPLIANRRGSARDRYGNWYWIDVSERRIRVRSSGSNAVSDFWPVPTVASQPNPGIFQSLTPHPTLIFLLLRGLAVTEDHYLVVGVHREGSTPAGLLIFDLHGIGEPVRLEWPAAVDFAPFDLSPVPGGGVWVLDRVNRRYWKLDRHFNVVHHAAQETTELSPEHKTDFQPVHPIPPATEPPTRIDPARTFPRGIQLSASSLVGCDDPCAIEGLPDGTLLILDRCPDRRFSLVYRYRLGDPTPQIIELEPEVTEGMSPEKKARAELIGHDFAFLPIHKTGDGTIVYDRLFITTLTGDQSFVFHLFRTPADRLILNFLPSQFSPMRLYSGKALVASDQTIYYDIDELWVPLIAQDRPRYTPEATLTTPIHQAVPALGTPRSVFDGREPDCVWHRLMLDACLPPGTSVDVWSRAANTVEALSQAEWQAEPPMRYWRHEGSELPFVSSMPPNYHTWEILFQKAHGRYLQLKLRLRGDGRTTPRLRALRVYYPRFSYLEHYLPAVYRQEPNSASLMDRYLANLEGIYTALEDRIAAVQMLFDPLSIPAEALDWLGRWFGVALDPAWDESRRRLFIQYAMVFFQYRGTVHGLKMALALALDPCVDEEIFSLAAYDDPRRDRIRIVERFRTRNAKGVEAGDPTGTSSDDGTHQFRVLLPTPRFEILSEEQIARQIQEQRDLAERIVNLEKPAHTVFDIRFYWAAFRLDEVRLGIDTLIDLGSRSPQFIPAMILNEGYLGESYLAPGHPQNVNDRRLIGRDRLNETTGRSAYSPHREDSL